MTVKKKSSGISDHKVKKGVLVSPLNDALGDTLKLSSWALERMPEYLWLGLILLRYGRKEGLERAGKILSEISKNIENLLLPRLSLIFGLPDYDQREVYDVIGNYVDKETIAPLTLIYKKKYYPIFNEYFYVSHFSFEERFKLITKAIELYSPHQANEATDLRFLAVSLLLFTGKLVFVKGTEMTATAFTEYAYTNHNDEKMRLYRAAIRSTEGGIGMVDEGKSDFSSNFWRSFGMITQCNPMKIEFPKNTNDYSEFVIDCRKALEYVFYTNKEKYITEDKLSVVIGVINYAIKIFEEINSSTLGNGVLGRQGLRTIVESYIMLKYLIRKELEHPNIWREYKLYGISKYKLILLKDSSEITGVLQDNQHSTCALKN